MKRLLPLLAVPVLVFPGRADALTASTRCEGKWVVVSVDVPNTTTVLATWGGKTVQTGNKFVPDTGGGNPSGDYDMNISIAAGGQTFQVRTPNCAPTPTPAPAVVVAPVEVEPTAPVVTRAAAKLVTVVPEYDPWPAIVEAVRALP